MVYNSISQESKYTKGKTMARYTALDAMRNSLTGDERNAIQQVINKMRDLMPEQREAFAAKIKETPVVKIGAVELSKNAVSYLLGQINRID